MKDLADMRRQLHDLEAQLQIDTGPDPFEQTLQSIVDAVPDIIYRVDSESRIVFISEAVRTYGVDPADLVGTSLFDLIHPEDRERARHCVNDRRTGERSTRSFELRLVFPNDKSISFELNESDTPASKMLIDAQGVYSSDLPRSERLPLHPGCCPQHHRSPAGGDVAGRDPARGGPAAGRTRLADPHGVSSAATTD
ncbi:MAG: PAS domain-containing protein, partial [Candidatus Latescibacterota bacterium]